MISTSVMSEYNHFGTCFYTVSLLKKTYDPYMVRIFTYGWLIFMVIVGKYSIHGSYGNKPGKSLASEGQLSNTNPKPRVARNAMAAGIARGAGSFLHK